MTTLMKASNEWANRPADQRFASLEDLHSRVTQVKAEAVEVSRPFRELGVEARHDGSLSMTTPKGFATLSHWAFGQIARMIQAPANYLRTLPPVLTAEAVKHGMHALVKAEPDKTAQIYLGRNGDLKVRALTSEKYTRIYNADITKRLFTLAARGWNPAPAAYDGSRGLYASDQDMFAFFVDNNRRIFEKAIEGGLSRGFFVWNSEVGAMSFGIMTFLYEYVCGNHIVWGASNVSEVRLRHVGTADDRAFGEIRGLLTQYADASADQDELRIQRAVDYSLGKNKDEVLDKVFGLRIPALTRGTIVEAYDEAEKHNVLGGPRSAWGLADGITRVSQGEEHAADRVALDRAAGEVIELAF